ncbi:MAG: threonine dehydratase I [Monoraphidium minutum]|nr:MAG: threonine dehydratase I [Monoraphidium minutum]
MRPLLADAARGVSQHGGNMRRLHQSAHVVTQVSGCPVHGGRGRTAGRGQQHAVCALPGASSSGRGRSPPRPAAASSQLQEAAAAAVAQQQQQQGMGGAPSAAQVVAASPTPSASGSTLSSYEELTFLPEDFELPRGVMSEVDRSSPESPDDVFRCPGCTAPECMTASGCATTSWRFEPDGYLRAILTARVYDVAVITPLDKAVKLSDAVGSSILLKREDLQPVFSFKLRGAYNKMAKLTPEQLARGVITSSAGNHAQGVALAAKELGCKATICMPVTTPDIKVSNVRRLGGSVELVGETYQEAQAHALQRAVSEGLSFVAPYDDPYTIAGQGTIGDEILRQIGNPADLDAIFVAVGGGGLIAGVASYVKALQPHVKVIGVEPVGANAMAMSLAKGARVTLAKVDGFADGVAVKQVGAETFRLCRQLVDGVVLVDNAAISAAIKDVFNETRSILEPAGAVAVAGAKAWLKAEGVTGRTVVAVTSGANINFERLRLVSELADLGSSTEVMMATQIPERPGAFRDFVAAATDPLDGVDVSVTEFKYRYSAGQLANILWSAGVPDKAAGAGLVARLNAAGMPTEDISGIDAAQVHLRHLVGGRARAYTGEIPFERVFQVQFPERTGALRHFLEVLGPAWNVTLFHYRQTGNSTSYVLLGIQVPPEAASDFRRAQRKLREEFTFEEIEGRARDVFNMFIQ